MAPSVAVHVIGADPGGGERPGGELGQDVVQLRSPLVWPEEIVGGDGDGDHAFGARRVRVSGRLNTQGNNGEKNVKPF